MKERIKEILVQKEGYSPRSAESTANDLESIKDSEIYQALIRWIESGKKTNVARGSFSCRQLIADLGMKYPAALIFLDWYCEDVLATLKSTTKNRTGGKIEEEKEKKENGKEGTQIYSGIQGTDGGAI